MARRHELAFSLNAGGVDVEALSRVDLEKMRLAGEHPVINWFPKVLGPMSLRPGLEYRDRCYNDNQTKMVRYVRQIGTTYMLLFSASELRISANGSVVQVPVVSTVIIPGWWTDASTGLATSSGSTTLTFLATPTATARRRQKVNVEASDRGKANILRIVVDSGPVFFRCGTIEGGQDLVGDTRLDQGTHKIAITPGVSDSQIFIELFTTSDTTKTISSIDFESNFLGNVEGDLVLPTPYTWSNLQDLRTWSEIDLIFVGDGSNWTQRIEHRGDQSWSICRHYTDNGPFTPVTNKLMTITPSALRGNITLTTSDAYWRSTHVGALVEVNQVGKTVTQILNAADQETDYVTVTGLDSERDFWVTVVASGWTGTLSLERSLQAGEPTIWEQYATYTTSLTRTKLNDKATNLTAHFRFKIRSADYTAGTMTTTLEHSSSSATGIARITGYTSTTVVSAEVLSPMGNTSASRDWRIGTFNDIAGHPRLPIIHDSRFYWFRGDDVYGSVTDDFTNYDDTVTGDSKPIIRSIGSGANDGVIWALSIQRLLIGTAAFEAPIQASDFGEPLTPTAWTVPKASFRGSADIPAVAYDDGAFFVQRSGLKVYELSVPAGETKFRSQDISRLNPSACTPGITKLAVQQQPMVRLYALRSDGACVVITFEKDDKVVAFTVLETDGTIEDVETLPGTDHDEVYFIVNRSGARNLERLCSETDQNAMDTACVLDNCTIYTGPVTTLTGLSRFNGQSIQLWTEDGYLDDVTVTGDSVTLSQAYDHVVAGLSYEALFKSTKLAYAAQMGTAIGMPKTVHRASLVVSRSTLDGLWVGRDVDHLDPMPDVIDGATRTASQWFEHYDGGLIPIAGDWNPDSRFVITADSKYGPKTVQSVVLDIETREDAPKQGG